MRYTVNRQFSGGDFYIYDTKAGLTTPVGQFQDETPFVHRPGKIRPGLPRSARRHAGINS